MKKMRKLAVIFGALTIFLTMNSYVTAAGSTSVMTYGGMVGFGMGQVGSRVDVTNSIGAINNPSKTRMSVSFDYCRDDIKVWFQLYSNITYQYSTKYLLPLHGSFTNFNANMTFFTTEILSLYAGREHILNPERFIDGTWQVKGLE